jgi:N-acetylglucosamine-6-phosphate deacetylase
VGARTITPGLIDIHTHGALKHGFDEPLAEGYATITGEQASRGVTSLLATITTAPLADMVAALRFCQEWMAQPRPGAQVLGAHVEGPFFSHQEKGAQDPRYIISPEGGAAEPLLDMHGAIRMMTYAPEVPGALDLTRRLARLGIVPAAGHSNARDTDILDAIETGLRHTIHIWSGQSSTIREGAWRKPGLLEATLAFDELTAEMISDNRHLPPTLMKLAYKCKGPDRLCVVSDATGGAGLPEGTVFGTAEMQYVVGDGVGLLQDGTSFAGSTTLLDRMLTVLTTVVDIPVVEAVRMASLTPARVIGVEDRKGSLEAGKDADLAVFDAGFRVWRTMIGGQWVYAA